MTEHEQVETEDKQEPSVKPTYLTDEEVARIRKRVEELPGLFIFYGTVFVFVPLVIGYGFLRFLVSSPNKPLEEMSEVERDIYIGYERWQLYRKLGYQKAFASSSPQSKEANPQQPTQTQAVAAEPKKFQVREVATNDGTPAVWGSQYFQVGELLDMWADLVENQGDKAEALYKAYAGIMEERNIPGVTRTYEGLTGSGLGVPHRDMEFARRGEVTVTVYVATQGQDLYMSWRAFIQAKISAAKLLVMAFVLGALAMALALGSRRAWSQQEGQWVTDRFVNWDTFFLVLLGLAAGFVVLIGAYGLFRRQGDFLALLRSSLNELQVDDVASLSKAVHVSLLQAADKVGIDSKTLEPRQPFYTQRPARRM